MPLDLTRPLQLNDGTPVRLHREYPNKLVIQVPADHPLAKGFGDSKRDFARDGTRNGVGASPPYDYHLVNVEPVPDLPTEIEWERLLFDMSKSELIAQLKIRNLIKPAPIDPVVKLAREIKDYLNPQGDDIDVNTVASMIRNTFPGNK